MYAATAQQIYLVRHGETEWSKSGQHTGRTDISLTAEGRASAARLSGLLPAGDLAVRSSPLSRALDTCRLAGFRDPVIDEGLLEWDYGVWEGRTTLDIRRENPHWSIWLTPVPGGESLDQVAERARGVIERITADPSRNVALFAHGHILRILAAAWIGLPPITGRYLALDTASVSVLSYERQTRVIWQWNRTSPATAT